MIGGSVIKKGKRSPAISILSFDKHVVPMIDTDLHVSSEAEDTVHILTRTPIFDVFFVACTGEILELYFDGWTLQHKKTFSLTDACLVPSGMIMAGPQLLVTFEDEKLTQSVCFKNLENIFASTKRENKERLDLVPNFEKYTSKCYSLIQRIL